MDIMNLRVTQNAYFSFLINTKQLLLVIFCDPTVGIVKWDGWHADANVRTDRNEGSNSYVDIK